MLQLRLVEVGGQAVEVASSASQSGASSPEQQAETKFESHEGVDAGEFFFAGCIRSVCL